MQQLTLTHEELYNIFSALEGHINTLENRFSDDPEHLHPAKKYKTLYQKLKDFEEPLPAETSLILTAITNTIHNQLPPEQMAKQIVNTIYFLLPNNGSISQGLNSCTNRRADAIKAAHIVCSYAYTENIEISFHSNIHRSLYWLEIILALHEMKA